MGGKTGTTTQQSSVSIPPEVLARYNAVNARAETTAQQPFTPYSGEFVAPLTGTQQAGISNINQAQGIAGPYYDAAGQAMTAGYQSAQPYYGAATSSMMGGQQNANALQGEAYQGINQAYYGAQPYQGVATGLGLASAGAVNPEALTGQNINQYMSPYVQDVVGTTMANLRQQQAQEQSQLLGNQITSGAFGGDRGRIAQANLARQQELASGQTVAGLMNQGYGQALQTAQQQQAQQLAAEQANRAALAGAGQQLGALGQQGFSQGMSAAQQQAALGQQAFAQGAQGAQTYQGLGQGLYGMGQEYGKNVAGLGTQAQQAALQGAQAQLGAGTVEQQTQQAQDTAQYNQFLQQQGYPFQIAQFLANIAMGTGALSGSTTNATTTSPQSFFSDRRLKEDVEKIGKTYDGQDIVRYKYKGEPGTRIGLIAQDVEKHHPDAVGLAGGYRTVDYDKATDKAAERGHFADGGLAGGYSSEGGAVMPEMAGMGFSQGGAPDINSMLGEILNAHQGMYPYGKAGLYGQTGGRAGAYGTSQMQLPSRGLMRAELVRAAEQPGAGAQAMQGLNTARGIGSAYTEGSNALFGSEPTAANPQGGTGVIGRGGNYNPGQGGLANFVRRLTQGSEPTSTVEVSARQPDQSTSLNDASLNANPSVIEGTSVTGNAAGGLVRGHYAMGGLPFSEAGGYIPESVLKDDETEKNKKAMQGLSPSTAPGGGQSGSGPGLLGTLGQVGGAIQGAKALGSAASSIGSGIEEMLPLLLLKSGGAVPRHGYALDGEVVDAKQDGLAGAGNLNPEVERIRNALSAIESSDRYDIVGRDVVRSGRPTDRAYGRYQVMGENVGPWTEAAFGQRMDPNEFLNSPKAQDAVVRHRIQQGLDRYGNPQDVASVWFTGQPVAQSANRRDVNIGTPEYLRRFQTAYDANNTSAPAPEGRAGLMAAVPPDNTGLGAAYKQNASGDGGGDEAVDYRAAVRRALEPEQREAPNWMQRNQDWLVPLLSGVGTMAASPSRYLGAALLQGVGGGAQQYAAMQQRGEEQQRQREQLGISRATTLVAQQREQVAEQQLREQMIQRVLQQFGDQLPNGMYRDPFSGQLVSPQRRMQIAMQMAAGTSSTGVPARAPAGETGAAPPAAGGTGTAPSAVGETGAAPPAAGETGAAPPSTGGTLPAAGETGARPPATPPAAGETAAAPPAAGAPAAGGTLATRPANAPPRMPWDNPPQFVPEDDPVQLRARAHAAQNVPGQRAAEEAVRLETLARKIESGELQPRDVNGNLYNGFVLRRQEEERQKAFLDEERAAQRVHYEASPQIMSNVRRAAQLFTNTPTGLSSELISTMTNIARSIPGGSAAVPDFLAATQATTETARKLALEEGFRKLQAQAQQGAGGRTNMALVEMMQTIADPRLGPEARYEIIARTMAREAQNDAWYASLDQRPAGTSLQRWRQQFNQENNLDNYINEVKSTMPGFAGMTPALRRQFGTSDAALPDNLRSPSTYNPLAPFQMRTVNGNRQFLMNGIIYDDRGRQIERVTQ
jgi:hypothetical protein